MSLKSIAKAVTPPVIWSALKRGRQSTEEPRHQPDHVALGYARGLEARFPELRGFGIHPTAYNADEVISFYAEIIPTFYPPARDAHLRNALRRLSQRTDDDAIKRAAARATAASELMGDGFSDRAVILKADPDLGNIWAENVSRLEASYGAAIVTEDWSGADRGQALIYYFSGHKELLRGKRILHFAAEANFKAWIKAETSPGEYITSDAQGNADETQDITAISHPDDRFDVVICHRVMEHVLDDKKGFAELYRVLKPGGFVSFSVPQAPHNPQTAEWAIPDLSHHGHVRQYGADLEDRMRDAGFVVELEPWLLKQDPLELRKRSAYPMRIFHLRK